MHQPQSRLVTRRVQPQDYNRCQHSGIITESTQDTIRMTQNHMVSHCQQSRETKGSWGSWDTRAPWELLLYVEEKTENYFTSSGHTEIRSVMSFMLCDRSSRRPTARTCMQQQNRCAGQRMVPAPRGVCGSGPSGRATRGRGTRGS